MGSVSCKIASKTAVLAKFHSDFHQRFSFSCTTYDREGQRQKLGFSGRRRESRFFHSLTYPVVRVGLGWAVIGRIVVSALHFVAGRLVWGLGTSADLQLWQQKPNPSYLDRNLVFLDKFWTGQIRELKI